VELPKPLMTRKKSSYFNRPSSRRNESPETHAGVCKLKDIVLSRATNDEPGCDPLCLSLGQFAGTYSRPMEKWASTLARSRRQCFVPFFREARRWVKLTADRREAIKHGEDDTAAENRIQAVSAGCQVNNAEPALADFLMGEIPSCVASHMEFEQNEAGRARRKALAASA